DLARQRLASVNGSGEEAREHGDGDRGDPAKRGGPARTIGRERRTRLGAFTIGGVHQSSVVRSGSIRARRRAEPIRLFAVARRRRRTRQASGGRGGQLMLRDSPKRGRTAKAQRRLSRDVSARADRGAEGAE